MNGRPFPYTRSRSNEKLQALQDGPAYTDELPNDSAVTKAARRFLQYIDPPWPRSSRLWFLWGDDRRAIRKLIDRHEDDIREALQDRNSTLSTRMSDPHWMMLCEEWLWMGKVDDDDLADLKDRHNEAIPDEGEADV